MSKVKIEVRNKEGKREVYDSVEITTRHYRDYLVMNQSLSTDISEVDKLDKQLDFIASLFSDLTVDMLLERTDMSEIYEIFTDVYSHLVGNIDPKEKG